MQTLPPHTRSAGVTAAATLALLGGASALFVWGWFFRGLLDLPADSTGKHAYQSHPVAFFSLMLVPPFLIALGLRTGVGLFQVKMWARKAAIYWAVIALAFSLSVIAFRPYETFVIPDRYVTDAESLKQLLAVSMVIFIFPVSVWWLFYFTRRGVKRQFEDSHSESSLEEHP
jgi:hypothetical protein